MTQDLNILSSIIFIYLSDHLSGVLSYSRGLAVE